MASGEWRVASGESLTWVDPPAWGDKANRRIGCDIAGRYCPPAPGAKTAFCHAMAQTHE